MLVTFYFFKAMVKKWYGHGRSSRTSCAGPDTSAVQLQIIIIKVNIPKVGQSQVLLVVLGLVAHITVYQ